MAASITPIELERGLTSATPPRLLDVREPEEHAFAALRGSKLIPLASLIARSQEIAAWKEDEVVVYCHHGIRSLHAIALLQRLGFTSLWNLSGGIDAWSLEVDRNVPRY